MKKKILKTISTLLILTFCVVEVGYAESIRQNQVKRYHLAPLVASPQEVTQEFQQTSKTNAFLHLFFSSQDLFEIKMEDKEGSGKREIHITRDLRGSVLLKMFIVFLGSSLLYVVGFPAYWFTLKTFELDASFIVLLMYSLPVIFTYLIAMLSGEESFEIKKAILAVGSVLGVALFTSAKMANLGPQALPAALIFTGLSLLIAIQLVFVRKSNRTYKQDPIFLTLLGFGSILVINPFFQFFFAPENKLSSVFHLLDPALAITMVFIYLVLAESTKFITRNWATKHVEASFISMALTVAPAVSFFLDGGLSAYATQGSKIAAALGVFLVFYTNFNIVKKVQKNKVPFISHILVFFLLVATVIAPKFQLDPLVLQWGVFQLHFTIALLSFLLIFPFYRFMQNLDKKSGKKDPRRYGLPVQEKIRWAREILTPDTTIFLKTLPIEPKIPILTQDYPRIVQLADEIAFREDNGFSSYRPFFEFLTLLLKAPDFKGMEFELANSMEGEGQRIQLSRDDIIRYRELMEEQKAIPDTITLHVIGIAYAILFQASRLTSNDPDIIDDYLDEIITAQKIIQQTLTDQDTKDILLELFIFSRIYIVPAHGPLHKSELLRATFRMEMYETIHRSGIYSKDRLLARMGNDKTTTQLMYDKYPDLSENSFLMLFPELDNDPDRRARIFEMEKLVQQKVQRASLLKKRVHRIGDFFEMASRRLFVSDGMTQHKSAVQNRLHPRPLVEFYGKINRWLKAHVPQARQVVYPFSGTDISTVLLTTNAQTIRLHDRTPFNLDSKREDDEELRPGYILGKATNAFTGDNFFIGIGNSLYPIIWELEALDVKNISEPKPGDTPNSFIIEFDWAYNDNSPVVRRQIIYEQTLINGKTDFQDLISDSDDIYFKKADQKLNLKDKKLPPVIIAFEDLGLQIPGYRRMVLHDIIEATPKLKELASASFPYGELTNGSIYVREDYLIDNKINFYRSS